MRRLAIATAAVVLLVSSATAGGWRDLAGQPAPAISAARWLNVEGDPVTLESLKGRVWLLNFIGIH